MACGCVGFSSFHFRQELILIDFWYMLMRFTFFLVSTSEVNERQRAILEEFAKEEINNELSDSAEGSW